MAAKVALVLGLIAFGLLGIYFKVEDSGWILFLGALGAFGLL